MEMENTFGKLEINTLGNLNSIKDKGEDFMSGMKAAFSKESGEPIG